MQQKYARVVGWGAYVPERVVTNHELAQTVDTSHEWIVQRSGIHERRIVADHETTSTLAIKASQAALKEANMEPTELDLIIVATSSPDYLTPPVSSQVQEGIGATDVPAFVLVTGCTGFIYSLATACQFIATGTYKNILVIGVEILSRHINWQDRSTCVLFGDASGAVILQATDEPCGLLGFVLGSDGSLSQHIIVPAGGSAEPPSLETLANNRHYIHMNGRQVFKFATRIIGPATQQALAQANLTLDDIDWIIPHQANLRIIQAAAKLMQQPLSRFIINLQQYGNTSAASIPLALCENIDNGRIKLDDKLLLVAFGAGLTWAAAVWQMRPSEGGGDRGQAKESSR